MNFTSEATTVSKGTRWTGRVVSGVVVAFMIFDSIGKLMKIHQVIEASVRIGFPENTIVPLGAVLLACAALYVNSRTSVLGTILLTAYLGGAVAANVRAGSPAFNTAFPIIFCLLAWLGLFLREGRLRALIPFRT